MKIEFSTAQELVCWIVGGIATLGASEYSHTFNVIPRTYVVGVILLLLGVSLFWLRFRKTELQRPRWLLILGNLVLLIFSLNFLLYVGGVATFYE